jgi:hypothetical protein
VYSPTNTLNKVDLGDHESEKSSNTNGGYKFKRRFKRKTFKRK